MRSKLPILVVGASIPLGPNAFRAFDLLGLEAAIAADAVFPDRYQMRDAFDGRDFSRAARRAVRAALRLSVRVAPETAAMLRG